MHFRKDTRGKNRTHGGSRGSRLFGKRLPPPENVNADFIISSPNPDRDGDYPDRHDVAGRTNPALQHKRSAPKTLAVQSCAVSPLQGALFQLLH